MDNRDELEEPGTLVASPGRFAASLVAALVATTPAFRGVFDDRLSLPAALLRFLLALAVLWGIATIASLALRRSSPRPVAIATDDVSHNNPADMGTSSVGADR